jgi:competence protein ComEC
LVNFFQKEGISRLDYGIATQIIPDVSEGWGTLLAKGVKIGEFADAKDLSPSQIYQQFSRDLKQTGVTPSALEADKKLTIAPNITIDVIQTNPTALILTIADSRWFFLGDMNPKQQRQLLSQKDKIKAQILWWSGGELLPELVRDAGVTIGVASTANLDGRVADELEKLNLIIFTTGKDGAIGWRPGRGLQPLNELDDGGTAL